MSGADTEDHEPADGGGAAITLTLGHEELVLRQRYELLSIANDIGIAILFTVGSIAFYWEELFTLGVTLFLVGSVELGIRPAIRLVRRVHLRTVARGLPHEATRDF